MLQRKVCLSERTNLVIVSIKHSDGISKLALSKKRLVPAAVGIPAASLDTSLLLEGFLRMCWFWSANNVFGAEAYLTLDAIIT